MRVIEKIKNRNLATELFMGSNDAVVVTDADDFNELTGVGVEMPLYIVDGLTKARKLNEFFSEIDHAPLDTAPYYTVLQSLMQNAELTYTDKVFFLAMVAKLWEWQEHFYNLTDCISIVPKYALIGYVMGLYERHWETDIFGILVCRFFSGDIDTPTFFTECDNLKNQ